MTLFGSKWQSCVCFLRSMGGGVISHCYPTMKCIKKISFDLWTFFLIPLSSIYYTHKKIKINVKNIYKNGIFRVKGKFSANYNEAILYSWQLTPLQKLIDKPRRQEYQRQIIYNQPHFHLNLYVRFIKLEPILSLF